MSKLINSEQEDIAWYQQFWPWFIIALIGSVVVASLITLVIAVRHSDDLVVDDYYKVGLAVNQHLEHRQLAERLGISAELYITDAKVHVIVQNIKRDSTPILTLAHPLEADRDRTFKLLPDPDGGFFANLDSPIGPRWHWTIQDSNPQKWLLSGVLSADAFAYDQ